MKLIGLQGRYIRTTVQCSSGELAAWDGFWRQHRQQSVSPRGPDTAVSCYCGTKTLERFARITSNLRIVRFLFVNFLFITAPRLCHGDRDVLLRFQELSVTCCVQLSDCLRKITLFSLQWKILSWSRNPVTYIALFTLWKGGILSSANKRMWNRFNNFTKLFIMQHR